MMHLLPLTFRFQLSSGKTILSAAFCVNLESAMRVPKTESIFHLCAHNETRSIAVGVDSSDRSPVGIHGMSLIPSITPKFTEPEKTFLCMDLSRWTRTQNR
jgi:hypothetical protein